MSDIAYNLEFEIKRRAELSGDKFTATALSRLTKLTQPQISRILNRKNTDVGLETIIDLANGLGISPIYLVDSRENIEKLGIADESKDSKLASLSLNLRQLIEKIIQYSVDGKLTDDHIRLLSFTIDSIKK